MKRTPPKWLKAYAALCGMIFLAASSVLLILPMIPSEEAVSVFSEKADPFAEFAPIVIDGQTRLPIEDAVIVIPEANASFVTAADGSPADPIRIPYRKADSAVFPKSWCEVTLLVYAEGYAPYALFYLQLSENTLRKGPTVMLFPDQGEAFSIIEGPPEIWVENLLEKYQPSTASRNRQKASSSSEKSP